MADKLFAGLNLEDFGADEEVKDSPNLRFFDVGVHEDVVIADAELAEAKDPNWSMVKFSYTLEGYKEKKSVVMFPRTKQGVDGYHKNENTTEETAAKASEAMLRKLRRFLIAIGFQDDQVTKLRDLMAAVVKVFEDPSKLNGIRHNIEIAYPFKQAHPDYRERGVYHLILANGKVLMQEDSPDSPVVFASAKDASDYAEHDLGEKVARFPDIKETLPPTTPNDLKRFGGQKTIKASDLL